jgi:hypothetical protein
MEHDIQTWNDLAFAYTRHIEEISSLSKRIGELEKELLEKRSLEYVEVKSQKDEELTIVQKRLEITQRALELACNEDMTIVLTALKMAEDEQK